VDTESKVKRSGSSFGGGFIIGIFLIAIATPCTWLNEGKDVKIHNLLVLANKEV
jgi:hypothetical protein